MLAAWDAAAVPQHAILCDNLVKIYKTAELEVVALQGLDLVVEPGELIAVVGASGSGKSTLQNILGGVDTPTAGRVEVAGMDLTFLTEHQLTQYRRKVVGFVWQQTARNLLPYRHRRRERRAADDAGRRLRRRAGAPRSRAPRACRAGAPCRSPPRRAIRRRAAARCRSDRAREPTEHPPRP